MDSAEVGEVLDRLRRLDGEPSSVEVKKAVGGLPKTVVETVSAFSNTNGGLIILGVDESSGFTPVQLPDPTRLRDNLVSAVSDQLEPGIRLGVDLVEVSGTVLVVAKIDPLPSDQRPCYVKSRGISTGSFVRAGDGDRRMPQAEIGLAIANRGQPQVPRACPRRVTATSLTCSPTHTSRAATGWWPRTGRPAFRQ